MNVEAVRLARPSLVAPMRYENVPRVGASYWTAISVASIFGRNLGDFISLYLHWGHWRGLLPLAIVFAALIGCERRFTFHSQAWYWAGRHRAADRGYEPRRSCDSHLGVAVRLGHREFGGVASAVHFTRTAATGRGWR